MARTYKAEGRQLAYFLRGIFVLGGLLIYFNIPGLHWGFFFGIPIGGILIAEILGGIWTSKRRKANRQRAASSSKRRTTNHTNRTHTRLNADEVILSSKLSDLSGAEFERLLALYFRDQGYEVKEVGVGGNDGGVDLVITDRRGERIAVQAKCYSDRNNVPVQTVRELVAAKRNHDCILSLLVTTSDLTSPAKAEAEKFKVDYWHGAILEQKLMAWGKWKPGKKINKSSTGRSELAKSRNEVAASVSSVKCTCGAQMVKRRSKQGLEFWGCTTYPSCRHTKSI